VMSPATQADERTPPKKATANRLVVLLYGLCRRGPGLVLNNHRFGLPVVGPRACHTSAYLPFPVAGQFRMTLFSRLKRRTATPRPFYGRRYRHIAVRNAGRSAIKSLVPPVLGARPFASAVLVTANLRVAGRYRHPRP